VQPEQNWYRQVCFLQKREDWFVISKFERTNLNQKC